MKDTNYMRRTIDLALKGSPSPNPLVGATIVQDGKIVGEGFHLRAGRAHAEINALKKAGKKSKNSTLYVTLEPCCFYGRTPACTDAILAAGVKTVVVALKDPNPKVNGRGIQILKRNGIAVKVGLLADDVRKLNQAYIKHIRGGLPYVILKSAMSLDGKIATSTGDSKWITSAASRNVVHRLRGEVDAIIVGSNTVISDNPRLTSRGYGKGNPLRVILDSNLKSPLKSNVFKGSNTVVFVSKSPATGKSKSLQKKEVEIIVAGDGKGRVSFKKVLRKLGSRGIASVIVEGGGQLNASAISSGEVDKILFFISPKIVGGSDAKTPVEGKGVRFIKNAVKVHDLSVTKIGDDVILEGILHDYS